MNNNVQISDSYASATTSTGGVTATVGSSAPASDSYGTPQSNPVARAPSSPISLASGASDSYGAASSAPLVQAPSDYRQERASFLTDLIGNSIDEDKLEGGNLQYAIRAPEAYVNGRPVTPALVVDVAPSYETEEATTTVAPGYIIIEEETTDASFQQETTTAQQLQQQDYYTSTPVSYTHLTLPTTPYV